MSTHNTSSSGHDIGEGTLIGDHFRVVRTLGAGGMGEVYLVENLNVPGRRNAVKVLNRDYTANPRYAELLASEAQKQSALDHDNIVQIHDCFPWRDRYCLILAFVDGDTLADIITKHPGGLPEKRALDVMLGVLKGLNYAHEHGVLHCDVKPANVLVDREQRVRVTDFGIARDMAASAQHVGMAGTPDYMSPEQVEAPANVGHRTDVFSAGVVLFEMLTGHLPFERGGVGVRFPQVEHDAADLRAYRKDLSPKLARIVATALQRDPAARFQGCAEFQQAIVSYRRMRQLRPYLVAASVIALAGAGAGYVWQEQVRAQAEAQRLEAERERVEAERIGRAQDIENEKKGREAIKASIVAAVNRLGSLCRETRRLAEKEKAMQTAIKGDFPRTAEDLRVQIADMKKNLAGFAPSYAESIGQLANFDTRWVTETIDEYSQSGAEGTNLVPVLREDYAAAAGQSAVRALAALQAACPR